MKKCISLLLLLALLCVPVLAFGEAAPLVVDQAQLLTSGESRELTQYLEELSTALEMDIAVLTINSLDGKRARDYADDYYDYNGYAYDGVLLLVCMAEREWWITTSGRAIDALTDRELDAIAEAFLPSLSAGRYSEAFNAFARGVEERAVETPREKNTLAGVLVCLGIGAAAGFITAGILKGQLKTVRRQYSASGYLSQGSLSITGSRDMFLYRNVTRRAKPKENSSTTHRSSSGRSHGGRGGKF